MNNKKSNNNKDEYVLGHYKGVHGIKSVQGGRENYNNRGNEMACQVIYREKASVHDEDGVMGMNREKVRDILCRD